jgi:hypothetical protein
MRLAIVPKLVEKAIRATFHLVGLDVVRRKSRNAHNQRIFFLHLPKCGGVSVNRALSRAFGAEKLAGLNPTASWQAAEIRGEDPWDYRTSLLFYYMAMKRVNVVTGHYTWSEEAYRHFSEDWAYITLLRDPVRRWFSHYFYDRYRNDAGFGIEEDLSTFLHSERAKEMGALYALRLSDLQVTDMERAVEQAKTNLEKFDVLGFTEDINDFVDQFLHRFEVHLNVPHKNKSPAEDKKDQAQVNQEYVSRVRDLCKYDVEIYDYARKLVSN